MVETTKTLNVQLTFVTKKDPNYFFTKDFDKDWNAKDFEDWLKDMLGADDVKVSNVKKFELEN